MPRIRTIKPEFWSDEKMSELSAIDRLVFLGLIGMADDYGRLHDNIKVIDAFIFPNSSETVRESVANLSRIGRIRRGNASNGAKVIEIVNWSKHQRVDKPQNHLALPKIDHVAPKTIKNIGDVPIPESFANHSGTIPEKVATLPGTRDQGSGTWDQGPGSMDQGCKGETDVSVACVAEPTETEVVTQWNSVMSQNCGLTVKRKRSLKSRLADPTWIASWREALTKAGVSDFCNGLGDQGWRADLEWFLRPDSVQKLMEGKFDNRSGYHNTKAQQRVSNTQLAIQEFASGE